MKRSVVCHFSVLIILLLIGCQKKTMIAAVEIIPQMGPSDGKPKVDLVLKRVRVLK
jgi:hypothetical protein